MLSKSRIRQGLDGIIKASLLAECRRITPFDPIAHEIRLELLRNMPEAEEIVISTAIDKLLARNILPTLAEQIALRRFNRLVLKEYEKRKPKDGKL